MSSLFHASKVGTANRPWSSTVNRFNGCPSNISMIAALLGAPAAAEEGGGPGSGTGVRPDIGNLPSK